MGSNFSPGVLIDCYTGKIVKSKIEGKIKELMEGISLLQPLLIVSQKRPEMNVPKLSESEWKVEINYSK